MITTVQCSICSQLNNKLREVFTDFRLHHTCSIIILWLHLQSGVIRNLLCNPQAFSPGIIIISMCTNTPTSFTGFLLGFLGRGGKCRVGAEEGGHAIRACVVPRIFLNFRCSEIAFHAI